MGEVWVMRLVSLLLILGVSLVGVAAKSDSVYTFICPQQATSARFCLLCQSVYASVGVRINGIADQPLAGSGRASQFYWAFFTTWQRLGAGYTQRRYQKLNQVVVHCYYQAKDNNATISTDTPKNIPTGYKCSSTSQIVRCEPK